MDDGFGGVALSSAVRVLRAEVERAMETGVGEELQFRLGPIELEFHVGVTNEGGGEAGIRFWVLTLGGEASHSREQTQTVKLTLTPHRRGDPDGGVDIADEDRLAG